MQIYDWDKIKKNYMNKGSKVSDIEFASREGVNYHYLVKKIKEENWYKERQEHLKCRPLSGNQKKFCYLYVKYYNASKAYREAYPNCSKANAGSEGHRLLRLPEIRHFIEGIQEEIQENLLFDAQSVIRKYIDIAFSDIGDLVEVDGYQTKLRDDADTSLIQKIRPTPLGVEVTLPDKMDALKELAKRFGLNKSDFDKEMRRKQIELRMRRLELQELSIKGDDKALEKLDNILNAIDKEVGDA